MTEQLPGLKVHINEGRLTGPFELPAADMEHIRYGGRVVMVLVADAASIRVTDTKDGDTKASWTFKVEDAAIVRDASMKQHLADTLFLDLGLTEGIGTIRVPSGILRGDALDHGEHPDRDDEVTVPRTFGKSTVPEDDFDPETGEKLVPTVLKPEHDVVVSPGSVNGGARIPSKDPALEAFLNDERVDA